MYVPPSNAMTDDDAARELVRAVGAAELVTGGQDGHPLATLLPVVWSGGTVTAHLARANPHWRAIADGQPALLVVRGPQAYVSPSWYATKTDHGRVVPTWNYSAVHLTGRARVVEDAAWLRAHVESLTRLHEDRRPAPWTVDDAPAAYVTGQLRGIVGVEVTVERVEGKDKLSQNRSEADRAGVVAGLLGERTGEAAAVAARMTTD
ncbi:FMN-binding negative transcriptional regulator [Nocardioides sp. CFH 31398]|uniref:FMN-binding negative transcriptional regulator n=1 Tax=Nocardioides sp. CFH 31398 TaxID=2919579 RepID=UPI001F05E00C|nr:FMN-binding negative transcriptional regulator [Nocardioides sp. CFH 31398]MCH1868056.1 FMN-binding negative transcriptional regulator [Nocardioides sp. CFH 31398]